MPEDLDWVHPLDAMNRRDPLPGASVRVILMATEDAERAAGIGESLVRLLGQRGRKASTIVVRPDVHGWNRALEQGLGESDEPVVIVTSATAPWTAAHLDPLLQAIDGRDHVIGRRPSTRLGTLLRRLRMLPYRVFFSLQVSDMFSPARIHRREALAKIPLQSASRFLDVEILAKATFFVQTIEEVPVPDLPGPGIGPLGDDLAAVFTHPILKMGEGADPEVSGPPEPPQGDREADDGPHGENAERLEDVAVEQPRPFEHDPPQGVEQLGQG